MVKTLVKENDIRRAAMDMLARREHSRLEVLQKLKSRVENQDLLEDTLEQLIEENLLCDERFCEAFVRSRMNNGYGPVRVIAELKNRGVAGHLISQYLDSQSNIWAEKITEIVLRKYGPYPDQDVKSLAKRQRFLQQRGFTFDQIREATRGNKSD